MAGGSWKTYNENFDDAFQGMSTLFIVSSLSGWTDIMFQAINCYNVDLGPRLNASTYYSLFFILFVLLGAFFFLNFFIGVLFVKYTEANS